MKEDLAHMTLQTAAGVQTGETKIAEGHVVMLPRTSDDVGRRSRRSLSRRRTQGQTAQRGQHSPNRYPCMIRLSHDGHLAQLSRLSTCRLSASSPRLASAPGMLR